MKDIKKNYLYRLVSSFFKHKCSNYEKVISKGYLKDGDTGVVISLGKEFECGRCGGKRSR